MLVFVFSICDCRAYREKLLEHVCVSCSPSVIVECVEGNSCSMYLCVCFQSVLVSMHRKELQHVPVFCVFSL